MCAFGLTPLFLIAFYIYLFFGLNIGAYYHIIIYFCATAANRRQREAEQAGAQKVAVGARAQHRRESSSSESSSRCIFAVIINMFIERRAARVLDFCSRKSSVTLAHHLGVFAAADS